jgi:hypothetical protein
VQSAKKTTNIKDALRTKAGLAVETPIDISIQKDAVEAGRKPLAARRPDVAALRAKALELYGFRAGDGPGIPAIESAFKFSPAEFDDHINYLHVEPLLDRSHALLERCLSHRSSRDALQIERWKLRMELDRFFRLDEADAREREAGGDTLGYERAVLESGAEQSLEENYRRAGEQLRDLTSDLIAAGLNRRIAARELAAWVAAWPLKDSDLHGDDAAYTFDGVRRTKPEHLFEAARQEADQDGWEQIYSLVSRRYSAAAESEAGRLRRESLELQAKLSLASIDFRRQRAQAERDAIWEKVHEVQSPGSVLNYNERIAALERDFSADFRDALACLAAARRGLKELYDYDPPFPVEGSGGYLDEAVSWVRRAQYRMTQLCENEQTCVLAVSLKQLTGAQWEAGRTASAWTFDIPDEMFAGQVNVRMRGLSVSVAGPAAEPPELPKDASKQGLPARKPEALQAEGFWSARVSLPATATMRTIAGASRELDQKLLPACFLGSVTDWNSARAPEVAGASVLHNASPVGRQWKLALSPKSTDGMETARLQDVQISLHLAVR